MDETEVISTKEEDGKTLPKTMVIAGGGVSALIAYGVLRETNQRGLWNIDGIEDMYGTSAGAVACICMALKYDWTSLDDYFIKRPWHQLYKMDFSTMVMAYKDRGIIGVSFFEDFFKPLFLGKDMSLDITMQEFFDKTRIEVHIYTTELHSYEMCDISYKTHPDWRVVDAVYASCAIPLVFQPLLKDGKCYADGGIVLNYPIQAAIQNGRPLETIFGMPRVSEGSTLSHIDASSNLLDYILHLMNKTLEKVINKQKQNATTAGFEIPLQCPTVSLYDLAAAGNSPDERARYIQCGVDQARAYIGLIDNSGSFI